jgi:hypothetical protein
MVIVKCQLIGEKGKLENYQVVFGAGPEHVSTTIPSVFFIIQVMKDYTATGARSCRVQYIV